MFICVCATLELWHTSFRNTSNVLSNAQAHVILVGNNYAHADTNL